MALKDDETFEEDFTQLDLGGEQSRKKKKFDLEDFIFKNRFTFTFLLTGLILLGLGIIIYRVSLSDSPKIEVLESTKDQPSEVIVEIAGAVEKPGVYKLPVGSRVEDLLIVSGGLAADADRDWVEKTLNRAGRLIDGQKVFIPKINQHSEIKGAKNEGDIKLYQGDQVRVTASLININTANQKQLEELPGIGPVYAQSIIEHRPYSNIEELVSKGVLKRGVYEKIKDLITIY